MARQGLVRAAEETPSAYVKRLARLAELDPAPIVARLQKYLYDPDADPHGEERRLLRQDLRKLRFKLAFTTIGNAS